MKHSKIEWTEHTFNPWRGCTKVSEACRNCYAESMSRRWAHEIWGANAPRSFHPNEYWKQPVRWNEEARQSGKPTRVFCASMGDVFEDYHGPDRDRLASERARLIELIEQTPHLTWMLLTKRPENIATMVPWTNGTWPPNVWLGVTGETQQDVEDRLPHLLKHHAAVRFLSCEPLLGPLDLRGWFNRRGYSPIDWVITGGESGPGSRPSDPEWFRSLRDQCLSAAVPLFFKQWGTFREFERMSKAKAGRALDGKEWSDFPGVRTRTHNKGNEGGAKVKPNGSRKIAGVNENRPRA